MFTKSYEQTIEFLASIAPGLENPGKFIKWAEEMCDVVTFIYSCDYEQVTIDLTEATKEAQDYEDD